MAVCDICNATGFGTIIKAADMSGAVKNGFNPFKNGLLPDLLQNMGVGSSYDAWREEVIRGGFSRSDWNVCNNCLKQLQPFLEALCVSADITRKSGDSKMDNEILEVEADSIEEARRQISSQCPADLKIISEEVISDGKPKTQRGIAETTEAAFGNASDKVPDNATILDKRVVFNAQEKIIEVQAFNETMAESMAKNKITNSQSIRGVSLKKEGKKGLLGIGKKPHIFEIVIWQNAVVEMKYTQKARVRAKIGEKPYEFRNRRFYSNKPLSDLEGIILLAPIGEAKQISSSKSFIGTIEDTVGAWNDRITKQCSIYAIGHQQTKSLFSVWAKTFN